jgi:hypothetical protein
MATTALTIAAPYASVVIPGLYLHVHDVVIGRYQPVADLYCLLEGYIRLLDRHHHVLQAGAGHAHLKILGDLHGMLLCAVNML